MLLLDVCTYDSLNLSFFMLPIVIPSCPHLSLSPPLSQTPQSHQPLMFNSLMHFIHCFLMLSSLILSCTHPLNTYYFMLACLIPLSCYLPVPHLSMFHAIFSHSLSLPHSTHHNCNAIACKLPDCVSLMQPCLHT